MTNAALTGLTTLLQRVPFDVRAPSSREVLSRVLAQDLPYRSVAAYLAAFYGGTYINYYQDVLGLDTEELEPAAVALYEDLLRCGYDDWLYEHYAVRHDTPYS